MYTHNIKGRHRIVTLSSSVFINSFFSALEQARPPTERLKRCDWNCVNTFYVIYIHVHVFYLQITFNLFTYVQTCVFMFVVCMYLCIYVYVCNDC